MPMDIMTYTPKPLDIREDRDEPERTLGISQRELRQYEQDMNPEFDDILHSLYEPMKELAKKAQPPRSLKKRFDEY